MKSVLVTLLAIIAVVYGQYLTETQVGRDECLSVSNANTITAKLAGATTHLNSLRDATTMETVATAIKGLYDAFKTQTYWTEGYATVPYVGFSTNDNFYSIRDCSLPENSGLHYCGDSANFIVYVRNEEIFGDLKRHIFYADSTCTITDTADFVNETNNYITSQRPWFTTVGWNYFVSATSLKAVYALSVTVAGSNAVVAVDRSFREPCKTCLQNSWAIKAVDRMAKMGFEAYSSITNVGAFSEVTKKLYEAKIQTGSGFSLQTYIGYIPHGDHYLVKDCTAPEYETISAECLNAATPYLAYIRNQNAHSGANELTRKVYGIAFDGSLSSTTPVVANTGLYNTTFRPWFLLAEEQEYGWTAPYVQASAPVLGRTYAKKVGNVIYAADITTRECEVPPTTTPKTYTNQEASDDECLKVSIVPTAVAVAKTIAPDFKGLTTLQEVKTAMKSLWETVRNTTYYNTGLILNAYVGTSDGDFYSLRNCTLHENAKLFGCNGAAIVSYIRNEVIFGDRQRHVLQLNEQGDLDITKYVNESLTTTVFNTTGRPWYANAGFWNFYVSATTGTPAFTFSSAKDAAGNVFAIDRTFAEPCIQCLKDSYAPATAKAIAQANLISFKNANSTSEFSDAIETLFAKVQAASSSFAIQCYFGAWSGDAYLLKDCSAEEFTTNLGCDQASHGYAAYIHSYGYFGDHKRRVFDVNADGSLGALLATETNDYFVTGRIWFQAAFFSKEGYSPEYTYASSSTVGRTYAYEYSYGVAACDITDRECTGELPTPPTAGPAPTAAAIVTIPSIFVIFVMMVALFLF